MTTGNIGVTSQNIFPIIKKFLYSDHEIFLRELVSNAVDATQKLKTLASVGEAKGELGDTRVRVLIDKKKKTLTVQDHGIGMTAEEVDKYINQIAFSGAEEFVNKYKDNAAAIIGHFGLGFYSAFMVAESITVITRKYGEDSAWKWVSDGADGYTIEETTKAAPGTDIIMTLKVDSEEEEFSKYLEEYELRSLIKRYSDYIRYPIRMEVTGSRKKEDSDEYESYMELDTLNSMVPIWQRSKSEVTEEEYKAFYKEKFHDYEDPMAIIPISVEGAVTYKALLFIYIKELTHFMQRKKGSILLYQTFAS